MEKKRRILRNWHLDDMTGLSRTTRWRLERRSQFPKRRKLSPNAVGWYEDEVLEWLAGRNPPRR